MPVVAAELVAVVVGAELVVAVVVVVVRGGRWSWSWSCECVLVVPVGPVEVVGPSQLRAVARSSAHLRWAPITPARVPR